MGQKTIETVVKTTDHPLEDFFGIEKGTTEVVVQQQHTELIQHESYDSKDSEIEDNFQEVHDKAMAGHNALQEQIEDIDPRYVARVSEVAIQYLNTALSAASEKAKMKMNKDKIVASVNTDPQAVNKTLIIDTNELIKQLKANRLEKIVSEVSNTSSTVSDDR